MSSCPALEWDKSILQTPLKIRNYGQLSKLQRNSGGAAGSCKERRSAVWKVRSCGPLCDLTKSSSFLRSFVDKCHWILAQNTSPSPSYSMCPSFLSRNFLSFQNHYFEWILLKLILLNSNWDYCKQTDSVILWPISMKFTRFRVL